MLAILVVLVVLVVVALVALWFTRQRASQTAFVLRLRPNPANRLVILKWLALLPLIPAGPLLLFGLAWFVPGLFGLGLVFVAAAVVVWRAFAREWPVSRVR